MQSFWKIMAVAVFAATSILPAALHAQTRDVVRVATVKSAGAATLFWAKDKGYFNDEGIDVEWTYFDNLNALTASIIAGQNDVSTSGIIAGFYNMAGKQNLKIIAGLVSEKPGFRTATFVVTPKAYEAGVKTPIDLLKGQRIAVATVGSAHQYALLKLADKYGTDPAGMKIVALQSNGNLLAALKTNAVEAAVMSSIPGAAAAADGAGRIVGYVGDETPYNGIAFLSRGDTVEKKREAMVRFIRAMLRANKDYDAAFQQKGPDGVPVRKAAAQDIMAVVSKWTEQPVKVIAEAMPYIEPDGDLKLSEVQQQVKLWQQSGMVDKTVVAEGLLDTSILDAARKPAK